MSSTGIEIPAKSTSRPHTHHYLNLPTFMILPANPPWRESIAIQDRLTVFCIAPFSLENVDLEHKIFKVTFFFFFPKRGTDGYVPEPNFHTMHVSSVL